MIANTNNGGRKAAGQNDSNNAIGDNMVAPKTGSTDQKDTGELVSNISGSRPETPPRRSDLPLPPSGALLGAAAGGKGGLPPTGDGQAFKKNKEVSAQHDGGGQG